MPCEYQSQIDSLLSGSLPLGDAERLESHLLECTSCSALLETRLATDPIAGFFLGGKFESGSVTVPEEQIVNVIEAARRLRSGPRTEAADSLIAETIKCFAPPESSAELGRLGRYVVLDVLGCGGMGVVFRAMDQQLGRHIALKVMVPRIAATASARERFLRESQSVAAIEHENICSVYDAGDDRGVLYIAMQLLDGETLQQKLDREGRIGELQCADIGRQVAEGLAAAHEAGLVHRDVKPDNIWLQGAPLKVKLIDFGLVRTTSEIRDITQSGDLLGTPRYMAPEQARGDIVDHRCDLFSLGCVLYRSLSGMNPIAGENIAAISIALVEQDIRPLHETTPCMSSEFPSLVMSLLSKDRVQRPQTSLEVAQRLAAIQSELLGRSSEQAKPLSETEISGSTPSANRRTIQYGRGAVLFLIGSLLAAAIMFSGFLWKLRTADGEVLVQVDAPSAISDIEIDGKSVSFSVDKSNEKVQFAVIPGKHELHIRTTAGAELVTNLGSTPLEVKAGKTVKLRAWFQKKDQELQIARHLFGIPRTEVQLQLVDIKNGTEVEATKAADLMTSEFYIRSISLRLLSDSTFSASDLERIGTASRLQSLGIETIEPLQLVDSDWKAFLSSNAARS